PQRPLERARRRRAERVLAALKPIARPKCNMFRWAVASLLPTRGQRRDRVIARGRHSNDAIGVLNASWQAPKLSIAAARDVTLTIAPRPLAPRLSSPPRGSLGARAWREQCKPPRQKAAVGLRDEEHSLMCPGAPRPACAMERCPGHGRRGHFDP